MSLIVLPCPLESISRGDVQPTLAELEKNAIVAALKRFGSTGQAKEKAADSLGISRSTFYRKIKDLGLDSKFPNRES